MKQGLIVRCAKIRILSWTNDAHMQMIFVVRVAVRDIIISHAPKIPTYGILQPMHLIERQPHHGHAGLADVGDKLPSLSLVGIQYTIGVSKRSQSQFVKIMIWITSASFFNDP